MDDTTPIAIPKNILRGSRGDVDPIVSVTFTVVVMYCIDVVVIVCCIVLVMVSVLVVVTLINEGITGMLLGSK